MSSWRDFALRGFDSRGDRMGLLVLIENLRSRFPVSPELKGEG
jgi:hypothetical protein